MDSHIKSYQFDMKDEDDPLSVSTMKTEPRDNEIIIKIESSEFDIRNEICPDLHVVDFVKTEPKEEEAYNTITETYISRNTANNVLNDQCYEEFSQASCILEVDILPFKKRRMCNFSVWKKNVRKIKRNKDQSYENTSKKLVEAAQIGPHCSCPNRCCAVIPDDKKNEVFKAFWELQDFNLQNSYLCSLMNAVEIKRRYTKAEKSRRNRTFLFYIKYGSQRVKVCKKAFLSIHGLHKHRGRVENLQKHIICNSTNPPVDKRGKHNNRLNKNLMKMEI